MHEEPWHNDWCDYLHFRPAFAQVIDDRYYSLEWLDSRVMDGSARVMVSDHAAIIVERREYPTGAADVHGLIAAGDLDEIRFLLIPRAEAWGRDIGCIAGVIESREGWARVLREDGYEPYQQAIRKEL